MKKAFLFFLVLIFPLFIQAQNIKIMLVTGGHSFDTLQFFQLFDELEGVEYTAFAQPEANQKIANGEAANFDVLVFYDMWKEISLKEKNAYLQLTEQGKPFLFLHHSIVSYQNWPEFEKMVGGKYVSAGEGIPKSEESTYEHDVWVYGRALQNHPLTKGLAEIKLFDEVYGNMKIADSVQPLIQTNHPNSSEYIAWENKYNASKIIYLQSGHDYRSYQSIEFRKLVLQAITYLAHSN